VSLEQSIEVIVLRCGTAYADDGAGERLGTLQRLLQIPVMHQTQYHHGGEGIAGTDCIDQSIDLRGPDLKLAPFVVIRQRTGFTARYNQ